MNKAVLLRRTPNGSRAFPVNKADADKMVGSGTAKVLHSNLYEEKVVVAVPEVAEEPVYATKVMAPEMPVAKPSAKPKKPSADKEKA
jgi:hypothetical protein